MINKIFKIAVASGKGGVGKSMLASSLAVLFSKSENIVAVDCDVDAPNLAIWLDEVKNWEEEKEISTLEKPQLDSEKCTPKTCKDCIQKCPTGALHEKNGEVKLNTFLCEGCGVCEITCPPGSIKMVPVKNAIIKSKITHYGFPLVSAQLKPGNTNSGKVVSEVKAKALKNSSNKDLMILDTPPGTGCPVIAALRDVDFVVLVTEPTPAGLSDLKRGLETVNYFQIPYGVVINKHDINPKVTCQIKKEFEGKILGKISYDQKIIKAISQMKPVMKTVLKAKEEIKRIYKKLQSKLTDY